MGNYAPRIEITASLSRHNSSNDEQDNSLYTEMVGRIREVIEDPTYKRIFPMFISDGIDWGGA